MRHDKRRQDKNTQDKIRQDKKRKDETTTSIDKTNVKERLGSVISSLLSFLP